MMRQEPQPSSHYDQDDQDSIMSMTSSQRSLLKHKQRMERKQGRPQLGGGTENLSASQSTIKSSPSSTHQHQHQPKIPRATASAFYRGEDNSDTETLALPPAKKQPLRPVESQDISLGQLINNSMTIGGVQATQAKKTEKKPRKQEELMETMKKQEGVQRSNTQQVGMQEAYSQLRELRGDLARVRQVLRHVDHNSSSSEEDEDEAQSELYHAADQDERTTLSKLEQRYRFLGRSGPNPVTKDTAAKENSNVQLSVFELNNKLIEDAYAVSKRREYVQHHIGEVDMSILDTYDLVDTATPYEGYSKAMQQIKGMTVKTMGDEDVDEDDSRSQNDGDHEFTGINIQLLTDDKRLQVTVPSYDNHYRLYFENPDAFQKYQGAAAQVRPTGKVAEEKSEDLERQISQHFSRLSEPDQIDLIGKIIPDFGSCLRDLQQTRLKYHLLLERVKKLAPANLKSSLQTDRMLDMAGVTRDFKMRFDSQQSSLMQSAVAQGVLQQVANQQALIQNQQRRKGTFGEASINTTLMQPQKSKLEESQHQQPTQLGRTADVQQRIKDQLGDAESKLKDAQLARLQEKVKGFAATEKHLRLQVMEVEKRDESLVTKVENAVCFGKIMVTSRPVSVQEFGQLLGEVKYQSMDVWLQERIQLDEKLEERQEQGSLPERIDEAIGVKLEVEFNEMYNILRSPIALREAGFASRFGLVTPEQQMIMYSDVYMTQEIATFNLAHADFFDMGILIQNNRESKRMMFFKLINHNLKERKREVYLMSVFEDQVAKWENCLDPCDEIKACDRTYKLIKDKLLRAVIDRQRQKGTTQDMLQEYQDASQYLDYDNWEELQNKLSQHNNEMMSQDFPRLKDGAGKKNGGGLLASSDEDEYSVYERRYQENANTQSRKLLEVGLRAMETQYGNNEALPPLGGRTEDLNREIDQISRSVQLRVKSKMIAENEKEDRQKNEEQMRRQRAKEAQNQEFAKAVKALSLGTTFLKYGALGPPKQRHVFLAENGKRLCWKDPGATSASGSRFIIIKEITKVEDGRSTKKFKRFKTESEQQETLSFSVHTKKRTLDLEAPNMSDKTQFMANLQIIMKQQSLTLDPKKSTTSLSAVNQGAGSTAGGKDEMDNDESS